MYDDNKRDGVLWELRLDPALSKIIERIAEANQLGVQDIIRDVLSRWAVEDTDSGFH